MVFNVVLHHVYKYPVDFVVKSHFVKYPYKNQEVVLSMETVEESRESDGTHYRRKLATCKNFLPNMLKAIKTLNEKNVLLEEESWYNAANKEMKTKSRNLTWDAYAVAWEETDFSEDPDNPRWTIFSQKGGIKIKSYYLGAIASMVEYFLQGYIQKTSKKAIEWMEELLEERAKLQEKEEKDAPFKYEAQYTPEPAINSSELCGVEDS